MVSNKRVILHWVPTDKILLALQNLGFLNKRGKSRGKLNLNSFLNDCIGSKIAADRPELLKDVEERLVMLDIERLTKERDDLEARLCAQANRLTDLRKSRRAGLSVDVKYKPEYFRDTDL